MRSRFIGGILLIVGTSIGGGMLALPIANAGSGFWTSTLFLFACWVVMTLGAFFILEVNLYLPVGKNMVSMASATLGKTGLLTAWISYLFLLYSLLAAYISGGADVLGSLFELIHIHLPMYVSTLLFTSLFGGIVYAGIRRVDLVNRGLMFAKLGAYLLLVLFIFPFVRTTNIEHGDLSYVTGSLMILITSFGFAIIVPNLREYFNDDIKTLKKVVFIGSLIPLLCYIAWDAVIMGSLPNQGTDSLMSLMHSDHATSSLASMLTTQVHNTLISSLFHFFTSICMLTAFLGVSLCLLSFLSDGLNLMQQGKQGWGLLFLTFAPPFILVIFYPGAYIHALNYAGFFCVILLLLLPALMSFAGRKKFSSSFVVPGGRMTAIFVILCSIYLIGVSLY